jgi:hypothetical protein
LAFQEGEQILTPEESMGELERLTTIPGCTSRLTSAQYTGSASYADAYDQAIWATAGLGSNPGRNLVDSSRLISYEQMRNATKVEEMKQVILDFDPALPVIWENSKS